MPSQTDIGKTIAVVAISIVCIAGVRSQVAEAHLQAKDAIDVNLLPPPEQVVSMSLGYRSALADVLWAQVLVTQGLRMTDKRRYDTVADLIDTINALDPEFRTPYLWSDALITLQATEAKREDCDRVRAILERGLRNRPLDADLWRTAGQFVAFIAPGSFLKDPNEITQWKLDGARMLARAAELGGDQGSAGWSAVSSAHILSKQGEREAAIRLLQRTLAVTEDEELRDNLQRQLGTLIGEAKLDRYKRRQAAWLEIVRNDVPFVGKTTLNILGPPFNVAYCAGGGRPDDTRCAQTWNAWAAADEKSAQP